MQAGEESGVNGMKQGWAFAMVLRGSYSTLAEG